MLDSIVKIIGLLLGVIGSALGLYNFFHARRKEKRAFQIEEEDWAFYTRICEENKRGSIHFVEDGSEEHRRCERLVAKGLLERMPNAGYVAAGKTRKRLEVVY